MRKKLEWAMEEEAVLGGKEVEYVMAEFTMTMRAEEHQAISGMVEMRWKEEKELGRQWRNATLKETMPSLNKTR